MTARGKGSRQQGLNLVLRPERVEAALWRVYRKAPEAGSRQKLFSFYHNFAKKLATAQFARRKGGNFDLGDVEQLAFEALIQAINRYCPERGVPFEAFARRRINGHISNGLAQASEASAQYRYHQRAEKDRLQSLRAPPAETKTDPLKALSSLSATIAIGLMLDEDLSGDVESVPDTSPNAYESLAWNELHRTVHELVDGLAEREAYVIRQHYRNGVSFRQIAALLGVSTGRVSQIHKAALQRLRGRLAKLG